MDLADERLAFWEWIDKLPNSIQTRIPIVDLEPIWEEIWKLRNLAMMKEDQPNEN